MSQDIVERADALARNGEYHALRALITTLTAERDFLAKNNEGLIASQLRMKDRYRKAAVSAGDRATTAEALVQSMREAVEQAFRDGIAYASMVKVTDVDLAWEQSRARAALSRSEV